MNNTLKDSKSVASPDRAGSADIRGKPEKPLLSNFSSEGLVIWYQFGAQRLSIQELDDWILKQEKHSIIFRDQ